MIMSLLTKTTNFTNLENIARAAIILCPSENIGEDENKQSNLADKSRILLCNKIKGYEEKDVNMIADRGTEVGCNIDDCSLQNLRMFCRDSSA